MLNVEGFYSKKVDPSIHEVDFYRKVIIYSNFQLHQKCVQNYFIPYAVFAYDDNTKNKSKAYIFSNSDALLWA